MSTQEDVSPDAIIHELTMPRPIDEYHEDMGAVLWWKFPIEEAPYVGGPNDLGQTVEAEVILRKHHKQSKRKVRMMVGGWPGYHTHFTPIPTVGRRDYNPEKS